MLLIQWKKTYLARKVEGEGEDDKLKGRGEGVICEVGEVKKNKIPHPSADEAIARYSDDCYSISHAMYSQVLNHLRGVCRGKSANYLKNH